MVVEPARRRRAAAAAAGGGGARERIRRSSIRELHHLLGAQMELLAGKRVGYRLERCQPGWAQAQPLNRKMQ